MSKGLNTGNHFADKHKVIAECGIPQIDSLAWHGIGFFRIILDIVILLGIQFSIHLSRCTNAMIAERERAHHRKQVELNEIPGKTSVDDEGKSNGT